MCAYSGDAGRPNSASVFVGGFILGGIVVGTLGAVYAPQVSLAGISCTWCTCESLSFISYLSVHCWCIRVPPPPEISLELLKEHIV